jgi:hypothetical protein
MVVEHRPKRSGPRGGPNILDAAEAVSEKVMSAAFDASQQLNSLGIRHAIVGGIAVGAHGAPRATKDVDFIVRQEDAFSGTLVLSFKAGVPISVRGIAVDYLTPEGNAHAELLQRALDEAPVSEGMPVIPLEALVILKLQAARRHDIDDVARLCETADVAARIQDYVAENAPELQSRLELALGEP